MSATRRIAITVALLALLVVGLPSLASGAAPGRLYAFGDNTDGELGNATNNATNNANPTPTLVPLPGATGGVTQVAAGASHSLAVTSTGQLYAFGQNEYGQLGNATNNGTTTATPTPAVVSLPGATGGVTQVAAGASHSLAVTSTGQLYAFGYNYYGQLGNAINIATTTANPTPTLVSLPGATGPVTQVAAGAFHSLAVTSTGQLYAFGYNYYGQLGSAINIATTTANPTPTLVSLPGATGPVTQVAAGALHSLAVTSTGQLYAFGENQYGELGNAINNGTNNANPIPSLVSLPGPSGPVSQIVAGNDYSLAVTSTGQLYAFGYNYYGQLGGAVNNGTETANPTPLRAALPAGLTVATLARGAEALHTLLVLITAPGTTPPTLPGTTPPTLSGLRASPSKLSLAGRLVNGRCVRPTGKNRKHKPCTWPIALKLSYTLNSAATVSFTLARQEPGRKVNGRCLSPTKKNSKHKRCIRLIKVPGSITHRSTAGANTFRFGGRIGGKTLAPSSYLLTAAPTANGRRGNPQTVTVKLVK
ncbi:MAG: hypothetical protein JO352_07360 [Chloroflexi bacterium]|nr:hypothetical protein [Chloroflexota bacterium]